MKFYICKHCGNIIAYVRSSGVPVVCCGEPMAELTANTTDAAVEKHVPVVELQREGHVLNVTVGEVEHPMEDAHYIEWIALEAEGRLEVHYLEPGMKPTTFFAGGSKTGTVYAYCNLHGLWSATF